jgi:hypothetical protein
MPAQHLRRVNLIERQRDQSERSGLLRARPTAVRAYPLFIAAVDPPPTQPLASATAHPSYRPEARARGERLGCPSICVIVT